MSEPYNVPSASMAPTIEVGDVVLASKMAYGYSRFSPPRLLARALVLPHGRMFASSPRRGDLVIFKLPRDETTDYIKRIVGLPGDTVQLVHGRLVLNGAVVPREDLETLSDDLRRQDHQRAALSRIVAGRGEL